MGRGLEVAKRGAVREFRSGDGSVLRPVPPQQFGVPAEAFRLDCNLFADHVERQYEIEQFWLDALGLPQSCLRKSTVNVYSKFSQKKRQNRLPYGTVRICVHSTHVVQSIYGSIQEYGGFDRPEWLG